MRTYKSDGALGDDPLLKVLKCGGLHLVVSEVVPVGQRKSLYVVQCWSGELKMAWS